MRQDGRERASRETLAIPQAIRAQVDERDQGYCRICGEFLGLENRAQHHIVYGQGVGARRHHDVNNLITVGWLPGQRPCHEIAHSHKGRYQDLLLEIASGQLGNVTALQLLRWNARKPMAETPQGNVPLTEDEVRRRFFRRTQRSGRCLIWTGPRNDNDYGQLTSAALNGIRRRPADTLVPADDAAFYFAHGRWPDQRLSHSCDTPPCVEVEHLREINYPLP